MCVHTMSKEKAKQIAYMRQRVRNSPIFDFFIHMFMCSLFLYIFINDLIKV